MWHEYKAYLENFMMDFDFPKEAQIELNGFYQKVFSDTANFQTLTSILDAYKASKNVDYRETLLACKNIAAQSNVSEYVIYALTLIMMTKIGKTHYQTEKIPDIVWKNNFLDLKYKLDECKLVKGVWGIFVPDWQKKTGLAPVFFWRKRRTARFCEVFTSSREGWKQWDKITSVRYIEPRSSVQSTVCRLLRACTCLLRNMARNSSR